MSNSAAVQAPCPWHRDTLQQLQSRREAGRLPHALLLTGAAGIGKSRLALSFVHWLLCEAPRGGLACGQCQGCHLSTSGTHPDLCLVEPSEPGKAIRIDQIRDLVDFASRTAQYSGYRVILLSPADAMNRAAQNALLKTLEEPGEQTLLLLLSHQASALLPTVRSRCQQMLLPLPEPAVAVPWLAQQVGGEESAKAMLVAAGGAPLRAVSLEQSDWFASRAKWVAVLARAARGEISAVSGARQLAGQDLGALLDACYSWVHQALRLGQGASTLEDAVLRKPLAELSMIPAQRLLDFSTALVRARRLFLSGANPNKDLLLEQLMLVLAGVEDVNAL